MDYIDDDLKACCYAIKGILKFKKSKTDKDFLNECFLSAYIKILENKKNQDLSFEKKVKIVQNEVQKAIYKRNQKEDEKSFDEEYSEEEQNNFNILKSNCLEEEINYNTLKDLFINFYKNYNLPQKKFIIEKIFNNTSFKELAKKYKITINKLTEFLYNFRVDFLNYLVDNGYFESKNNFNIQRFTRCFYGNIICLEKKKQGDLFDFSRCPKDFKIYKLIRENIKNINKYAKSINIPPTKLDKIIKHKSGNRKLYLYEINILRKKYFNEYTLEELAL